MNRMRSRHTPFEVWPGYVDALTSLIMVMIFLLLIFATGQAVLSSTLAGKDRALAAVNARINDLSGVLTRTEAAFRQQTTRLNQVAREAEQSQGEERRLKTELATAMQREIDLNADLASLRLLRQQLETERTQAITQSQTAREMLARQTELNALSALAMATLQQKLDSQEEQLTKISAALDLARKDLDTARIALAARQPHEVLGADCAVRRVDHVFADALHARELHAVGVGDGHVERHSLAGQP